MSAQGGFSSAWWAGFTDSQLDAFLDAIQQSSLLYSMLTAFEAGGGTITVGEPGGGTFYSGKTEVGPPYGKIIVDPTWLPNSTSGLAALPSVLADILSHELGHAVLLNGNLNPILASNPDAAVQVSLTDEGTAGLAEYIVQQQLRLNPGAHLPATLTAALNAIATADGVDVLTLSSMASLSAPANSAFVSQAIAECTEYYATARPSTVPANPPGLPNSPQNAGPLNYSLLAIDEWALFEFGGYTGSDVNFSLLNSASIQESGNSTRAC